MAKIYQRAEDKNVSKIIIYGGGPGKTWVESSTTASHAYKDKEKTIKFTSDELLNASIKGAIIVIEDGMYAFPVAVSVEEGYVKINTVGYTVYSSEYTHS